MDEPRPSPALKLLQPFVGSWDTEGEVLTGPSPVPFRASDVYEWLSGGHFLLHRFRADMPDGLAEGIEVIGYDPLTDAYPMRSFDSSGNDTLMQASLHEDVWVFAGEGVRFTGGFDGDALFAGLWEAWSEGENSWRPWMKVVLRRSQGPSRARDFEG